VLDGAHHRDLRLCGAGARPSFLPVWTTMEAFMKHRTISQLKEVAQIQPTPMTREARLARWAEALERESGTVRALRETEIAPWRERLAARAAGSALTVALADPVLRAAGLSGETYRDALQFFALSDAEAHFILCSCHAGDTMSAREAAGRIRAVGGSAGTVSLGLRLLPAVIAAGMLGGVLLAAL
jgi:hypothetical protein